MNYNNNMEISIDNYTNQDIPQESSKTMTITLERELEKVINANGSISASIPVVNVLP